MRNKPFENQDFWTGKYGSRHTPWDLGETSEPVRNLVRDHFPPQGRVFIPGCGRGYEAMFLAEQGYRVTAVDFVEEPLRFLRSAAAKNGLELEVLHDDMFNLPSRYTGVFDVFLEQTCLCTLHPARWTEYEAMAHRVLRPGGQLLGVFMEADVERPPPYNCPPHELRGLFSESRWRFDGMEPQRSNPARPGPEFNARFTRLDG